MYKTCDKISKGALRYEIDYNHRFIRLSDDFPATGFRGARFDQETKVPFGAINSILNLSPSIKTHSFYSLFSKHSTNNGPMLTAALIHENIVQINRHGGYRVIGKL